MTITDTIRLIRVHSAAADAVPATVTVREDISDVLAQCHRWRRAFRDSAVAFPATVLTIPRIAEWIRKHGCEVDASSPLGLAFSMSAGVPMKRVMFRCANTTGLTITDALDLGVGQFIVDTVSAAVKLGACASGPLPVLVDVTDPDSGPVTAAAHAEEHLDLCGVYRQGRTPEDAVLPALEVIADLRGRHRILPIRLGIALRDAGSTSPESLAEAICDAVEEGCSRYRLPRPALTVFPDWLALTHGV